MTQSPSTPIGPAPQPPVAVNTAGGPVTLLDLPALEAQAKAAQEVAGVDAREAQSLRALAETLWIQRGTALVSKVDAWSPAPQMQVLIQQALPLIQSIDADNENLESIQSEPHKGVTGLLGKVSSWNNSRHVLADRAQALDKLNLVLVQIGRQAPNTTVPAADVIGAQATAAEAKAEDLEARSKGAAEVAASTDGEVRRRSDSQREMGFDALYLTAYLQMYGPRPIDSPLILKRGEWAYLAVPATLARQQTRRQWVGGSSGFSFPIGHTGIRYRVGSFRGHPIQQQFLGKLGPGTLVVTSQRIGFIGSTKSTSVSLTKLLHIEGYTDALAVFQEGRENPDLYFVSQPKLTLFWINWVLDKAST